MRPSGLTMECVHAAQDGDNDAQTAVLRAMEGRIASLAEKAARSMRHSGPQYREEFTQHGREAVWQALSRFNGGTVEEFYGFMVRTVEGALLDAVRSERNPGADASALKVFGRCFRIAGGDPYLAERISQFLPAKGHRLSADRAHAARLAFEGAVSIDVPLPDGGTLADVLSAPAETDALPEQQRTKEARVHSVLGQMGPQQRTVLMATYGIGGHVGDDELAERLGVSRRQVQSARKRARIRFAELFSG